MEGTLKRSIKARMTRIPAHVQFITLLASGRSLELNDLDCFLLRKTLKLYRCCSRKATIFHGDAY